MSEDKNKINHLASPLSAWAFLKKARANHILNLGKKALESWVGFITVVTLVLALLFTIIALQSDSITSDHVSTIGDFIAGIAGALAFLWLVYGYQMQRAELKLQRKEFTLQRVALESQVKEFKTLAKQGAMHQVIGLIDRAKSEISKKELSSTIKKFDNDDFSELYSTIINDSNAQKVYDASVQIDCIKSPIRAFYSAYETACRLYFSDVKEVELSYRGNFVSENWIELSKVPYLKQELGLMLRWSDILMTNKIRDNQVELASLISEQEVSGKKLSHISDAIDHYTQEILESDAPLPIIAQVYAASS